MNDRAPKKLWRWRTVARIRRSLLALLVFGQTAVASYYLLWIMPYHGGTPVEIGLLVLFALLYAWIAVGFWTAVVGFVLRLMGGDKHSLLNRYSNDDLEHTPLVKTAIVLPVYHEPVHWTFSGLKAVYQELERNGQIHYFEFFILSDSRNPEIWLEEQAKWHQLCDELGAHGRLFYRRRGVNLNYKSGNVADFLRRWGRLFKYMVVLDADSLMSGRTIVRMVQLMEREPQVGILQTNPSIINGQSLFARLQQFGNRLYSSLFATGLAAVQMGHAAFWGHNAILRVEPFMQHCGLRKLRGFGVFEGPIMSHDFVEAAYIGRAGYEVWLEPGLGESFEESPPTLADELSRDKRWAKGNLQHLWILCFGRRIRLAHRMAFLNGIMAYVASPLWLAFLALTTVAAAELTLSPIEYFPAGHEGLFPLWPEWRPEWALTLALSTLALLFVPKFLAIIDAIIHGLAKGFGGPWRLFLSVWVEIVFSVLLAPIRMLAHSRFVIASLLNVSLSWAGQNRTEETGWREALITQAPGLIIGGSWAVFAWWLDVSFFIWSLPVAVPLILAAPTSVLLSRVRVGQAIRRAGLLLIPEELATLPLLKNAAENRAQPASPWNIGHFEQAVLVPLVHQQQLALARPDRHSRRAVRLNDLVDQCIRNGPAALNKKQISELCEDRVALAELHRRAWIAPTGSYWGQAIARL
ncbi:glucans biosynthesis glucosyltransferase MdoH [Marinobacter sp. ELB17]|uniref:glucans biosynthesis glucosyltransferase MdoH n=1 Tax=Marinobacter sp. ELB17 TaxID=270374 RepID=UPI0000F3B263|nr:glucans biosynthesis glucosyltransferase MdoH [Marinobacter sp. ELB17]EAZ98706.1 glucosyltransferase MdoH [Marinobacter sp. ELB17]